MTDWPDNLPISKTCPLGCSQGMVLEIDPHEIGTIPVARYRCQDCDRREELCVEIEETRLCPRRDGRFVWEEGKLISRDVRIVPPNDNDQELLR